MLGVSLGAAPRDDGVAVRSQSYFGARYRRLRIKLGAPKPITASEPFKFARNGSKIS
jgi:hypothetical protein